MISAGTTVTGVTMPWNGVNGTYTVNNSQTVGSTPTITAASNIVNVTVIQSGSVPTLPCKFGAAWLITGSRNLTAGSNPGGMGTYKFDGAQVSPKYQGRGLETIPNYAMNLYPMGAGNPGTVLTLVGSTTGTFQQYMITSLNSDAAHKWTIGTSAGTGKWNLVGASVYDPPDFVAGGLWSIV
jgi:hypothetical protein